VSFEEKGTSPVRILQIEEDAGERSGRTFLLGNYIYKSSMDFSFDIIHSKCA
jgi:hypothetical protein